MIEVLIIGVAHLFGYWLIQVHQTSRRRASSVFTMGLYCAMTTITVFTVVSILRASMPPMWAALVYGLLTFFTEAAIWGFFGHYARDRYRSDLLGYIRSKEYAEDPIWIILTGISSVSNLVYIGLMFGGG